MFIGPEKIIEKKQNYLIPCSYHFYKNPPQIVRGQMQYLFDEKGQQYTDLFSGVSVMNCGHCNPEILKHTAEKLMTLQHTTSIYLTEEIVNLAQALADYLPGDLNRSFFCMSGSEANEGALLLAKLYTQKEGVIYFKNSLHGRTQLTMSITGIDMWRTMAEPSPHTFMAKSFYPEVCKESPVTEHDKQMASQASLDSVRALLQQYKDQIGAIIIEPIQGNGGILMPEKSFMTALSKICKEHHLLLIADEVQTGYSRTGRHFAIEHFDIVPDIITSAKALGNGIPIAAFSTRDAIANAFTSPSASTLGGNPVASYNAQHVLAYLTDHALDKKAAALGDYLKTQLLMLKEKFPMIHDVRGIGLMVGAEIVTPSFAPGAELVDEILEYMKDHGVILGKNGYHRNVLAFQPPLVIEKEDLEKALYHLEQCLEKLSV